MTNKKITIGKFIGIGIVLIAAALIAGYCISQYISGNIMQMETAKMDALFARVDQMLFGTNIYADPDTAYFAKLESYLRRGEKTWDGYDWEKLIMYNQKKVRTYDTNIHSVYVALTDESAPYVLINGDLRRKDQVKDMAWWDRAAQMEGDCYFEWRQISSSFLNKVNLFTIYRSYDSVSYEDGHMVSGYIVVNYYQNNLMHAIAATAQEEEAVVLYNTQTGEYLCTQECGLTDDQIRGLLQEVPDGQTDGNSGLIRAGDVRMIYRVSDSRIPTLRYLTLKDDAQISAVTIRIYIIFVWILLLVSLCAFFFLLIYYRQHTRYLDGLVQVLQAAEGSSPDEEDALHEIVDMLPEQGTDIAIIARRILDDRVDIDELKEMLQTEQRRRRETETLYSHTQINSHFLLNTLDSIYWKSAQSNGMESEETQMIERLCVILKYALDSSRLYIGLGEEIACAKEYIAIQNMRRGKKIAVEWRVPAELENARVGKLLLQPILENSVQHGGQPDRTLHIRVEAGRGDRALLIAVSDDGVGMAPDMLEQMNQILREDHPVRSKHIGLLNVNRRIQLQYGAEYGITLSNREDGPGLTVEIRLKYRTVEE